MPGWRYAAVSVSGTSHEKAGLPCQDHIQVAPIPALGVPHSLIAVAADGAGSAARAEEGARTACTNFLEFARLALDWICQAEYLTDDFGQDVLADLQDAIATLARDQQEPVGSFACTLLGALVTPDSALFLQLGDGAIVYRTAPDGPWHLAARAQRGEFANETIFVTRSNAVEYIQAVLITEPIYEFVLMTDGVEFLAVKQPEARPHAPFLDYVLSGLRNVQEAGESLAHNEWIEHFLRSGAVNQRTDDDKTLVLATRLPSQTRP